MTDKKLYDFFKMYNIKFFGGRIELLEENVYFTGSKEMAGSDGHYKIDEKELVIDEALIDHQNLVLIVLLHEMVHADLYQTGYLGYEEDGGHHVRFYAGLDKLYQQGAYEPLL
jgi:hypothetical protein